MTGFPHLLEPGSTPWADPWVLPASTGGERSSWRRLFATHTHVGRVSELPLLIESVSQLRADLLELAGELRSHMSEAQRRNELLLTAVGLPLTSPEQIDALADDVLAQIRARGSFDPVTFATERGLDIRIADLAFKRLVSQDRIEEA